MDNTTTLGRRLGAEYCGTAALLMAIVGSGIMGSQLANGVLALVLMANALATGMALQVFISIWGPVSGGHFNPAVTLVMALRREITSRTAAAYMVVQILGGISGVLIIHAMFDQSLWQISQTSRNGFGQFLSEMVATFGLLTVILFVGRWRAEAVAGAVGGYITAAIWFTASTSFANPAVTVGRALTDGFTGIAPADIGLFITAQIIGAVLASFYFSWQTGSSSRNQAESSPRETL